MVNVLDIISVYRVIDVQEFLGFGSGVREGGFGGDCGRGERGSGRAGGMGDRELSRLM